MGYYTNSIENGTYIKISFKKTTTKNFSNIELVSILHYLQILTDCSVHAQITCI